MPPKPVKWGLYGQMAIAGIVCCVGGPALVYYVSPTEEQLFQKYNPDLQKRSLQNRAEKQQGFDDFVNKLKEYSKSDKPIWEAAAEAERKARESKISETRRLRDEVEQRKAEMRRGLGGGAGST